MEMEDKSSGTHKQERCGFAACGETIAEGQKEKHELTCPHGFYTTDSGLKIHKHAIRHFDEYQSLNNQIRTATRKNEDIRAKYEEEESQLKGKIDRLMTARENLERNFEKEFLELEAQQKQLESILSQNIEEIFKNPQLVKEQENIKNALSTTSAREPENVFDCSNVNPRHLDLIENLYKKYTISSDFVYKVMRSVDRGDFAPNCTYTDRPSPIGFHVNTSAPHMHAAGLEMMKKHLKRADKALDIGSGCGFMTVCMAKMMPVKSTVIGIDHVQQLVNDSVANVRK
eukprot:TRINITY_DN2671_c0_g2_i2.p1 TRINITY_DN2671_c0_g2~~TRINITY_DN2671_c0_g2_i2.p1  ORF type:complete len:286 (+),score=59.89 TRINITY_DN2671_c0_g2_i2:96-953(+)